MLIQLRRAWSARTATRVTCFPTSLALLSLATLARTFTVTPAPATNLDLAPLGRIGVAGNFTGISLYEYDGQSERPINATENKDTLMVQLPNSMLANLLDADSLIQDMCVLDQVVVLGGGFTSLDGKPSSPLAVFDLATSKVTVIQNISGRVEALLCDRETGKVYVGGTFKAADSSNAIVWDSTQGLHSLPFAGFNGPVTSIYRASDGHIIFGGSFSGLGDNKTTKPKQPDGQVINLSAATIKTVNGAITQGFSDPTNIVCKTAGVSGAGNTWLMADDSPGTWDAKFEFGFVPTKLRLWNTRQDGRGVKTWRYTALPLNGIMNFTYVDPADGTTKSCTSECPLSDNSSVTHQDFFFVNRVGMDQFKIDVSAWYGKGGGLNGIELFGDNIFAYAINDFNEPACANTTTKSTATTTGSWSVQPSGLGNYQYLSARLPGPVTPESASVTFFPDVKEKGNYTVSIYTPGCIQDSTCASRGWVNITANLSPGSFISTDFWQSNNYEKYDSLSTTVVVEASSSSFRPSVTLRPVAGQDLPSMVLVAGRVGFNLTSSSTGLNGLYEYDPSSANTSDLSKSTFDRLGSTFSAESAVAALVGAGDVTYIGGNFTAAGVKNIIAVNSKDHSTVTVDGGINGEVMSMYLSGQQLFVGGDFNNKQNGSATGLNNVAIYDTVTNKWSPLGAGVDQAVQKVVPMKLNISSNTSEEVITITGNFEKLLAFEGSKEMAVQGFAVWVKSQNNWIQNLQGPVPSVTGRLTASLLDVNVSGSGTHSFYTGSVSAQALNANGVAALGAEALRTFPVDILPPSTPNSTQSNLSKRTSLVNRTSTISGVAAGLYEKSSGRNLTILGGHFSAEINSTTLRNLVIIDGDKQDAVSGLPSGLADESVILALAVSGDTLFAGGKVNGTVANAAVQGLISYNMASKSWNTQPPSLSGAKGVVSSINVRPNSGDVYVGGSFTNAGSLGCPGVCMFDTKLSQWDRPSLGLEGDVNCMRWTTDKTLIVGGSLKVNGTTQYLASYDASGSRWSSFPPPPGPVDAFNVATEDGTQFWATGTGVDGKVYVSKYDGSSWKSAGLALEANTVISSLQVFSLTAPHESTDLMDASQGLMLTGSLGLPGLGTVSAAIYDGKSVRPYALTGNIYGTGSITTIFVENARFFTAKSQKHLELIFIVLIALAISLVLMFLIVAAGLALDRYRKKRDGYMPAPTSMFDRGSGMARIPPQDLLGSINQTSPAAPHV